MSELDAKGSEIFDQTPVSMPIHFERPTPLHLRIRQQILQAMRDLSNVQEYDTPEEADDFDLDDVPEFNSPYEMEENFDHLNAPLSEQGKVDGDKTHTENAQDSDVAQKTPDEKRTPKTEA